MVQPPPIPSRPWISRGPGHCFRDEFDGLYSGILPSFYGFLELCRWSKCLLDPVAPCGSPAFAQVEHPALWESTFLTFMGVDFFCTLLSLKNWGRNQEKYYWGFYFICFIFCFIFFIILLFCIPGNIFHLLFTKQKQMFYQKGLR